MTDQEAIKDALMWCPGDMQRTRALKALAALLAEKERIRTIAFNEHKSAARRLSEIKLVLYVATEKQTP